MKSLKQARKDSGLTQYEIAGLAHITQTTLSNIERMEKIPSKKIREKLQRLFPDKINWLDVPKLNVKPADNKADWYKCEQTFRRLLRELKTLPAAECNEFAKVAIRHLKRL